MYPVVNSYGLESALMMVSPEHISQGQRGPGAPHLPFGRQEGRELETIGGNGGEGDEGEDEDEWAGRRHNFSWDDELVVGG